MSDSLSRGMARRDFLTKAALLGGSAIIAPWISPVNVNAAPIGAAAQSSTGFDPAFALNVAIPLAFSAYNAMSGSPLNLPPGYQATAQIQGDRALAAALAAQHPVAAKMVLRNNIFGLIGNNLSTGTAFVAFRGTTDLDDVLTDLDIIPTPYGFVPKFGCVQGGFHAVYRMVRASIMANLGAACAGCNNLLIVGHSLGGALSVVSAPDIFVNIPPNLAPRLITFAGPKSGFTDFVNPFNETISSCYRVVNYSDLIPLLPPCPYEHVGSAIYINSGGLGAVWRHSLYAYRLGMQKLVG
ncbi:lipase family protein [Mycobacterium nebraskense]|uniref:lipase family protein n=1 Tax=Mycobacterium nebraskense TaxID=244292 RepID=UPI000ACF4FF1|nr:lipase family protein [Mycobacterium nebraskense]MBI2693643.1 lipase family protein [Mycobacterium nebraskense]MCV7116326.1 lipase family protein [Mycobacterium nebraskense]